MQKIIEQRVVGYRVISGTEFPIKDQLLRQEWNGKVDWQILRGLCDGVSDSGKRFRKLKDARAEF